MNSSTTYLTMKNKFAVISIILSIVIIGCIINLNLEIAALYKAAGGKKIALFGLTEMQFFYKYYFLIPGIIGLVLAIKSYSKELKEFSFFTIVLSIISIVAIFLRLWVYFVQR